MRVWIEATKAPLHAEIIKGAQDALCHMAEHCLFVDFQSPRTKALNDRITAQEHDLARANREWNAWQERAKKAEAANIVLEQRLANASASAFATQEKVNADAMERKLDQAQADLRKLVDRRIAGIPGPPWPTDVVADFKRLRAAMQAVIDIPPVRCGEYSYLPFVNGQNQQQVRIQEELRKALG